MHRVLASIQWVRVPSATSCFCCWQCGVEKLRNGVPKYVPQDALIEVGVNMAGGKSAMLMGEIFVNAEDDCKNSVVVLFPGIDMDFWRLFEGKRVCFLDLSPFRKEIKKKSIRLKTFSSVRKKKSMETDDDAWRFFAWKTLVAISFL